MALPRFRATASRIHLFNLAPAHHSQKNQKRVGRGDGSKRGGTSGKGNKGQKARAGNGKPRLGFEGGQTTILKRFPKKGFTNSLGKTWAPINLDRLQHWIDEGRLTSSAEKPITAQELLSSGCIHNVHDGVKILGDGAERLKTPVHIVASRASQSAIKAVEKLGGSVFCKYYNALSLRDCVKGRTDRLDAAPTRREDIQWYMNWRNRGYLSSTALSKNPLANDRWKTISEQLSRYKTEEFEKPRRRQS